MTVESPCDWFVRTGVVAHEQTAGDAPSEVQDPAVAAHLKTCGFCQKAFDEIAAVRRDVGALPATRPRDHWEQAVWSRIDARRTPRTRWRWTWTWAPIAMGLAAATFLVFGLRRPAPQEDGPVALNLSFERAADQVRTRGDTPVGVGDTLVIEASGITTPIAELRVYQDRVGLRFQCAGEVPCEREGTTLRGRWRVPAVGSYRVMVITGRSSLPKTTNSFDDDVGALSAVPGVVARTIETFEVW
ncbi:MAG TPA: hypothetical protein VGG33_19780 [Polyangia bacterium]